MNNIDIGRLENFKRDALFAVTPLCYIYLKCDNVTGIFHLIRQHIPQFGAIIPKGSEAVCESTEFRLFKTTWVPEIIFKRGLYKYIIQISRNFEFFHDRLGPGRWLILHIYIYMYIYISQPEIRWHDALYHWAGHYLKWSHAASVRIFYSRLTKGAVVLWTPCPFRNQQR